LKVSTSKLFCEIRLDEWHGKINSKFPVHAGILFYDTPTTATMLRDMIRGT
jgi:hypothetical protein